MFIIKLIYNFRMITSIILVCVCVGGDYLVQINGNHRLLKAAFDNLTHGIVGLISGAVILNSFSVRLFTPRNIIWMTFCLLVSSGIDVDHFLAAKSLRLKDATNLTSRPFLHNSLIPLILLPIFIWFCIFNRNFNIIICLSMLLCAFISHHTRDATRRGFFCAGIGHTKPVPYTMYILLTILYPHILVLLMTTLGIGYDEIVYRKFIEVV